MVAEPGGLARDFRWGRCGTTPASRGAIADRSRRTMPTRPAIASMARRQRSAANAVTADAGARGAAGLE